MKAVGEELPLGFFQNFFFSVCIWKIAIITEINRNLEVENNRE